MIGFINRTGFKFVLNGGVIMVTCLVVKLLTGDAIELASYGFWPDAGMVFGAIVACFGFGLMYSDRENKQEE